MDATWRFAINIKWTSAICLGGRLVSKYFCMEYIQNDASCVSYFKHVINDLVIFSLLNIQKWLNVATVKLYWGKIENWR